MLRSLPIRWHTSKTETQRTSKTHSNGGGGNYSPPKIETEEEKQKSLDNIRQSIKDLANN